MRMRKLSRGPLCRVLGTSLDDCLSRFASPELPLTRHSLTFDSSQLLLLIFGHLKEDLRTIWVVRKTSSALRTLCASPSMWKSHFILRTAEDSTNLDTAGALINLLDDIAGLAQNSDTTGIVEARFDFSKGVLPFKDQIAIAR